MYNSETLYRQLKDIEQLIKQNENPDGSCRFDVKKVFIMLEVASRTILEGIETEDNLSPGD
jgi:hypothetical protein